MKKKQKTIYQFSSSLSWRSGSHDVGGGGGGRNEGKKRKEKVHRETEKWHGKKIETGKKTKVNKDKKFNLKLVNK